MLRAPDEGKPASVVRESRQIGQRCVACLRKEMHHNVSGLRCVRILGKKSTKALSSKTSSVVVGEDAQAFLPAKPQSGLLIENGRLFRRRACKRLRPSGGGLTSGARRHVQSPLHHPTFARQPCSFQFAPATCLVVTLRWSKTSRSPSRSDGWSARRPSACERRRVRCPSDQRVVISRYCSLAP